MRKKIHLVLLVVSFCASPLQGWNYEEQEKWPREFCAGQRQSPINLQTTREKRPTENFRLENWKENYSGVVKNNGHTIVVTLNDNLTLAGGGLHGYNYMFDQLHFHWGSEHLLNKKRNKVEAHFVFHSSKYESFNEAKKYPDGLAVLGVFYRLSEEKNRDLEPIIDQLSKLRTPGQNSTIEISLRRLLPSRLKEYYRYFGSLTTPNCDEVVTWTVFKARHTISLKQLEAIKSLTDNEGKRMSRNFRKVHPLNGRNLIYYY